MWNLKRNDTNELTYKTERDHRLRKRTHSCWVERIVKDFGKVMYTLLYLKWIPNKDLVYSTGNSLNVLCQSGCEGCLGENGYMCMHS